MVASVLVATPGSVHSTWSGWIRLRLRLRLRLSYAESSNGACISMHHRDTLWDAQYPLHQELGLARVRAKLGCAAPPARPMGPGEGARARGGCEGQGRVRGPRALV